MTPNPQLPHAESSAGLMLEALLREPAALIAEGLVFAIYAHDSRLGQEVLEIRDQTHGTQAILTGEEAEDFARYLESLKRGEVAMLGTIEATVDTCAASYLVAA